MLNLERLQKDDGCMEGKKRWIAGEERFPEEAGEQLVIDPEASEEMYTALWDIITSFSHRNYKGILL